MDEWSERFATSSARKYAAPHNRTRSSKIGGACAKTVLIETSLGTRPIFLDAHAHWLDWLDEYRGSIWFMIQFSLAAHMHTPICNTHTAGAHALTRKVVWRCHSVKKVIWRSPYLPYRLRRLVSLARPLTQEEMVWGHCYSRLVQRTPLRLGVVSGC